jgi:hypothetical protein
VNFKRNLQQEMKPVKRLANQREDDSLLKTESTSMIEEFGNG